MTTEDTASAAASLLGLGTWTRQGPATLAVREDRWAVLVPGLRKQVTEAAWEVLGRRPEAEEFVDQLVEAGDLGSADKLTALLFGVHDGQSATVGVKGSTPLAVYTADGAQVVVGTEEQPLVISSFEGVRRVAFGDLPPEEPVGAPRVVSGIVPVRGFVHMTVDPAQLEEADRAALAEQVEKDGRSIETEEAKKRRAERPAPTPSKPSTSAGSGSSSSSIRKPSVATRKPGEMPPSLSRGGSSTSSSRPAPAEEASSGPNLFAGLFGNDAPATASATASAPAPAPAATPVPAPAAPGQSAAGPAAAPSAPAAESAQPAATPAPAATPEQAATPSPAATRAPAPSPAPPAPAETPAPLESAPSATSSADDAPAEATGARAETATTGSASQPVAGTRTAPAKRRLVSTSLFDRRRTAPPAAAAAPAPSAAEQATAQPVEPPSEETATAHGSHPAPAPSPPETQQPAAQDDSAAETQQPATQDASAAETQQPAAQDASAPGAPVQPAPGQPAAEQADAAHPAPEAAPAPVTPPASAAPAASPARPASPSVPTPEPPGEDELESPPTLIAPIDDGEGPEEEDGPAPTPVRRAPAPAPQRPAAPTGDLENSGAYDDLFGKTVFRRIEDAAVRRSGEESEEAEHEQNASAPGADVVGADGDFPSETRIPSTDADDEAEEAPVPEHTTGAGDFIDWVPGVGRTAPEIAQAAARRAARPQSAPPAYPQVHMAERPPAPNTGSRPAPTRPDAPQGTGADRYEQVSGPGTPMQGAQSADDRHGASPYGMPGPRGQQSPYAAPGTYGPQSAYGAQGRHGQQGDHGRPGPSHQQAPYGQQAPYPQHPPHGQQTAYGQQSPYGQPGQYGRPGQHGQPGQFVGPGQNGVPASHGRPAASGHPAPAAGASGHVGQQGQQPSHAPGVGGRHASAPHPVAPGTAAPPAPGPAARPVPAPAAGPSAPSAPHAPAAQGGPARPATRGSGGAAVALPGLVCANGHANSPERSACRLCAAPLSGPTRTVARPPLGAVAVSTGEGFVLDRTAVIGRRPRASRVSGSDVPQLITVPSPQQDISRSHLELRLEGWHVVALDLGTTNGTTLHREGYEPLRLRPREGVVLHDGDLLDLGDEVHLTYGEKS